jgi:formiminotetrahydrofolate cyclodeaminase
VQDQTLGAWLDQLGSSAPAPGGGAATAMTTAIAAGLVEMVTSLTLGKPAYAAHEQLNREVAETVQGLRRRALELAAQDAQTFDALMATYKLPRDTDEQKAARKAAISSATEAAARVPLEVAEVAAAVVAAAGRLPGRSNPNVLSDVAVGASLAGAAIESAAVNVEVNLGSLSDPGVREELRKALDVQLSSIADAQRIVTAIRGELTG